MTKKETIKDGLHESFYKNGQLKFRGNYKTGKKHGLWEVFYLKGNNNPLILHGQLMYRGNHKYGKRDGLWEWFRVNGQLERRGNYKNGEQNGLWEYFDRDGNLDLYDIPF